MRRGATLEQLTSVVGYVRPVTDREEKNAYVFIERTFDQLVAHSSIVCG
jgi:hypothetical protein